MPPDWLSWEFWVEAAHAPALFWAKAAAGVWAGYVANRDNIVPIATFLGAVTIAWAALKQAKTASLRHAEQTTADRERRITESFAKAVEQLGSDKLETRLGAIYTLERISQESEREYWPIMETLTAYVREHAPWPPRYAVAKPLVQFSGGENEKSGGENEKNSENIPMDIHPFFSRHHDETEQPRIRPATDVQAALTVLGRRYGWRPSIMRGQTGLRGERLDLRVCPEICSLN